MVVDLWWSPAEIKFTREQVEWLLAHYDLLSEGVWPPECRETGYYGGAGSKGFHAAHFEAAIRIKIDLDRRLDWLNHTQYRVVRMCCIEGMDEYAVAQELCRLVEVVSWARESGLNRMSYRGA